MVTYEPDTMQGSEMAITILYELQIASCNIQ